MSKELSSILGPDGQPIPMEMTVVSADQKKISWSVYEYVGTEIYLWPFTEGTSQEDVDLWFTDAAENGYPDPLTNRDDIKPGDQIFTATLTGWCRGTVYAQENGKLYAKSGGMMLFLGFDEDDRNCWICCGSGNLSAIKKLSLSP